MTTPAAITGALLTGNFQPQSVSGEQSSRNVSLPMTFTGITSLKTWEGSYSPANDQPVVASWAGADAPQFLLLIVDRPCNVILSNAGGALISIPVTRVLMLSIADLPSLPTQIQFDGRTSGPALPMAQGVAVNYELITARATLT